MPQLIQAVFGSGISTAAIVALFLNLLLPGRQPSIEEPEEEESEMMSKVAKFNLCEREIYRCLARLSTFCS